MAAKMLNIYILTRHLQKSEYDCQTKNTQVVIDVKE